MTEEDNQLFDKLWDVLGTSTGCWHTDVNTLFDLLSVHFQMAYEEGAVSENEFAALFDYHKEQMRRTIFGNKKKAPKKTSFGNKKDLR